MAEAPPAADDRYFYFENVTPHDWLFRGVAEVICGHRPHMEQKKFHLIHFQQIGLFLIDLSVDPVDGTPLETYVPDLVTRCRALCPERVILVKATVFDVAFHALLVGGLPVVNQRVYFPSSGRQEDFRRQFATALEAEPCRIARLPGQDAADC